MVFMVLYVDDILLIGNDVRLLSSIKIQLPTQFQMKDLKEAQYILGIKVLRDDKNRKQVLSQATYTDKFFFIYEICDVGFEEGFVTLQAWNSSFSGSVSQTPEKKKYMQAVPYASIVGSLMYAMLYIRSDIYFIVGMVSRY